MNVIRVNNHVFPIHTYIIYNDKNECILIDPSYEYVNIEQKLIEKELNLKYILLTHGHQDHCYSLDYFVNNYDVEVYMSKETNNIIKDPHLNLSFIGDSMGYKPTIINNEFNNFKDLENLDLIGFNITCHILPGHTQGCTVYEFDEFLITGDFIFKSSIGRTDFPGSDINKMHNSLKIFKERFIQKQKRIYPGHNEFTTIVTEISNNPFLR